MPAAVPLIGGAASIGGSLISSHAQKKAARTAADASAFKPYNTSNLFGGAQWDPNTNSLSQNLSPFSSQLADSAQGGALNSINNPFSAFGQNLQDKGLNALPGAVDSANGMSGLSPDFINQIMSGYGNLNARGLDLSGLAGQSANNPFSQQMIQQGQNLLGSNYNDVQQQQLGLLRQQAQPYEDQQTNSLFQRLFNQGRMGSTGGGRDITAFAQGLGQADTGRQLQSMNFAQGLRSNDQQIGANLFNSGNNSYLQGIGQAGQLGSNVNTQQLAALQGLQGFGQSVDNTNYSRANDRVARASDLFGFGSGVKTSGANEANSFLGLLQGLTGQQQNLAQLGMQAGGAGASAGANGAQFTNGAAGSPVGGFFQGLGGGLLGSQQGQSQLSGLFNNLFKGNNGLTSDQNIANSFYPAGS